jgi:hypothetical protein
MQWIIITGKDEFTGPFWSYDLAMKALTGSGRIVELYSDAERRRILGYEDRGEDSVGAPADLERVPAEWREALMGKLVDEVNDMSSRELAFLLLEAMDQDELDERVRELAEDSPDLAVVHH